MMKKKGVELSLNTIIIAIICLIVLAVIIAIFTGSMGDIVQKFKIHITSAGEKGDEAIKNIGFTCTNDELSCKGKSLYICKDEKWEVKEECKNGCKDKACQ